MQTCRFLIGQKPTSPRENLLCLPQIKRQCWEQCGIDKLRRLGGIDGNDESGFYVAMGLVPTVVD